MNQHNTNVVGIDVGGQKKGFHAVALCGGKVDSMKSHDDPVVIVNWCRDCEAVVVAVDAPCKWSQMRSSRQAERDLSKAGIYCFATPTQEIARKKAFYGWVFNGAVLYRQLIDRGYTLFDSGQIKGKACIETFPHAVVCAMKEQVVSAKHKVSVRRETLRSAGFDDSRLSNIDFVDAALCAVAAQAFSNGDIKAYGNSDEGFIVVPKGGKSGSTL